MTESVAQTRAAGATGTVPRKVGWLVLGVAAGVMIVLGTGGMSGLADATVSAMTATGVAALCYLAAAVTGIRWMSWVAVPLTSALPFLATLVPLPRWAILALAGLLLAVIGMVRARQTTLPQAAAMVGYFGLAVVALYLAPRIGLVLAGLVIAAHAGWDFIHYRRDIVVNRSLALWCMGLDLTVGAICMVIAIVF